MHWQRWKYFPQRGFTLIEALVVVALLGIIMLIGLPSLLGLVQRSKMEGTVQGVANLMRLARFEAIKQGVPVIVRLDYANGVVTAFVDRDSNQRWNPTAGAKPRATDHEIGSVTLANGVSFWGVANPSGLAPGADPTGVAGPPDANPQGSNVVANFTEDPVGASLPHIAIFDPDGSIVDPGGFELGDRDGNFIEVRVAPQATARITLWKFNRTDNRYYERFNKEPGSGAGVGSGQKSWEWY
jgi:prepilin-type N-terminal cleavage/methylation domain-containing protein